MHKHPGVPSTAPFPRYQPSGDGRDMYMSNLERTGKTHWTARPCTTPSPMRGRTDPMPAYKPSGTGRDLHICSDGQNIPTTGKSAFSKRPPASPIRYSRTRTETMPKYFNDGTGRDIYMNSDSRIPHTAKATFDERPQTQAARSKAAVRTAVLPPFSPSGTGRDTFHRIEYRDNRAASWSLRDYAPENTGIFTRAQFPDTRRNDRALRIERQCQQLAIHRLSTPKTSKAHSLATPGLIVAGSFLRT